MISLRFYSVSANKCNSESVSCHTKQLYETLRVKTAVSLGKRVYQTSLKINGSLAFTNDVKGLRQFIKNYMKSFTLTKIKNKSLLIPNRKHHRKKYSDIFIT